MHEPSLRDDLLAIPGVEGAEVEGTEDRPAGLRIRIAEGADQRAVGGAIRRVLTSHGLGTDTRLPGEPGPEPADIVPDRPEPEAADAPAVEEAPVAAVTAVAVADDAEAGDAPVIDLTDRTLETAEPMPAAPPPEPDPPGAETVDVTDPDPVDGPPVHEPAGGMVPDAEPTSHRLASVAVEEGRTGILVRVTASTGASIEQHAASSEGGVEAAVVRAVARLANPEAPDPTVVEIDDRRVEGADIVLIVLDVDGTLHAGSAVVVAGRAFALGRATWAALSL